MNPNFQNIGTAFVTAYYQAFDSCANGDERGAKISQFYHVSTHFCKGFIFVKPILLWAIRMVFILRGNISYQMIFSFVINNDFIVTPFPFLFLNYLLSMTTSLKKRLHSQLFSSY